MQKTAILLTIIVMLLAKTVSLFFLTMIFVACVQLHRVDGAKLSVEQPHTIIGCNIYDRNKLKVWAFAAEACLFYKDGSFIASQKLHLTMYDENLRKIWRSSIPWHHQTNKSIDGSEVLVLSETYHPIDDKMTRFDMLLVLDLYGRVIKRFDFFDKREEINRMSRSDSRPWVIDSKRMRNPVVGQEYSHANSFYQIPPNIAAKSDVSFAAGNYIINLNLQNITFVLDKDLKEILWHLPHTQPRGRDEAAHDVQVLPNGNILFYANRGTRDRFSVIESVDPIKNSSRVLYQADPPEKFFSSIAGGVQLLNNKNIFISDVTNGLWVHEIDLVTKKKVWSMEYLEGTRRGHKSFQQAKRENLREFLSKNKGL